MLTRSEDLDRRITIENFTTTQNEFNEEVQTWAIFVTVWAKHKDSSDLTKVEYLGAEQVSAFHMSHFVIRSSPQSKTITPSFRINYQGHIWNIKGTKETSEGRNRFIEITAVRANN